MSDKSECLFCRIVEKKIPAAVVHETPEILAFRDINPRAPVHVLVVPKRHVESILTLDTQQAGLLGQIYQTIQAVARAEKIAEAGFRVVVNNGRDADQTVRHLHYHVLGGRRMGWPPG